MRNPELDRIINAAKEKKFKEQASKGAQEVIQKEAKGLMASIQAEQTRALLPVLKGLFDGLKQEIKQGLTGLKIEAPKVELPPFPEIPPFPEFPPQQPFPKIPAPIVNVPAPIVNIPETVFPSLMKVMLEGIDRTNPMPVLVVDELGKPFYGVNQTGNYGGGPALPYDTNNPMPVTFSSVTITGITNSIAASIVDSTGIAFEGSNPLPVTLGGATSTIGVNVVDSTGVAFEGANAFPVSGTVVVSSVTNSIQSSLIDSSGVQYSGSNPVPITGNIGTVTTVTSITNSVAAANIDSSGVQYSGSNPFPMTLATTNATTTVNVAITDSGGVQYSGSNPVPITGTVTVGSATNTIAVNVVDSSGVAFEGANQFPISVTTQPIHFDVQQVSGATDSINLLQVNGTTVDTNSGASSAGTLRTILANNTVFSTQTLTDAIANADSPVGTVFPVGFNGSTWDRIHTGTTGAGGFDSGGALRVTQATDVGVSVTASQTGTWNIGTVTTLTGVTNTIATNIVDSSGVAYETANPFPVTGTITAVTNVTNSIQTVALDRDGNPKQDFVFGTGAGATALRTLIAGDTDMSVVVNSGTLTNLQQFNANAISTNDGEASPGTLRVIHAADVGASVLITGQNDSMLTYKASTTLPTAASDGADIRPRADKYGRHLTRPIQVRDLLATAYVSLTTGTEANFLAATAGQLYDLIWVMMSNQSTAAVQVDIRPVTAGNILMTFQVPANGTVGIAPPLPLPGGADTGNNWTVDMPDITGTTVNITGLFSREI